LVTKIFPGAPADRVLQEGDVILSVDGHDVADDGTIEFRSKQRTQVSYLVQLRQVGEQIGLTVLRDGDVQKLNLVLDRPLTADWLIPMEKFDASPAYFIYGGIVFCPLTKNLLREWGSGWYNAAPKEFVALLRNNFRDRDRDEVVIVLKVLAADVNQGYHNISNWIVDEVHGERVRNLRHLIQLVEKAEAGPFMEFKSRTGQQLVLDRTKVNESNARILQLYRIPFDRSLQLRENASVEP